MAKPDQGRRDGTVPLCAQKLKQVLSYNQDCSLSEQLVKKAPDWDVCTIGQGAHTVASGCYVVAARL